MMCEHDAMTAVYCLTRLAPGCRTNGPVHPFPVRPAGVDRPARHRPRTGRPAPGGVHPDGAPVRRDQAATIDNPEPTATALTPMTRGVPAIETLEDATSSVESVAGVSRSPTAPGVLSSASIPTVIAASAGCARSRC